MRWIILLNALLAAGMILGIVMEQNWNGVVGWIFAALWVFMYYKLSNKNSSDLRYYRTLIAMWAEKCDKLTEELKQKKRRESFHETALEYTSVKRHISCVIPEKDMHNLRVCLSKISNPPRPYVEEEFNDLILKCFQQFDPSSSITEIKHEKIKQLNMKWIRQLFCRHEYVYHTWAYKDVNGRQPDIWFTEGCCQKCNKSLKKLVLKK